MRIHRLEFRGIGPFAGRHVIDFAALGAGGIFLLEGPTGAGKSTIIDALTFGLYGQVAARAATADRIRSSYSPPEEESYVDLVFETGSGIFRVRRSPEYRRPKKRGEGTTLQQASVKLWRWTVLPDNLEDIDLGAIGDILSTRAGEADAEIHSAIGLSRDQFTQTVVLPQGEFAQFLKAGPDAREDILQRIFGTHIYEDLQRQLAESSREAKRAIEDAKTALQQSISRLAGATRVDDDTAAELVTAADPGRDTEVDLDHIRTLIAGLTETLTGAAEAAKHEFDAAKTATDDAQKLWDSAKQTHDLLTTRGALQATLRALDESAAEISAGASAAERGRKAALVQVSIEQQARDAETLASVSKAQDEVTDNLRTLGIDEPADDDALTALQDAHQAAVTSLETALRRSTELLEEAAALETLTAQVEERTAVVGDLNDKLGSRPEARASLLERQKVAQTLANEVPRRETELTAARQRLTAAKRVAALESEVGALAERVRQAMVAADAARVAADTAHARRIAGIAGELATELIADEPCPVCGSTTHPTPANQDDDHVSAEDVEAANNTLQVVTNDLVDRRGEHTRKEAELETAQATAGNLTTHDAEEEVWASTAQLAEATEGAQTVETLASELATFDDQTTALTEQLADAKQDHIKLSHDLEQRTIAWLKTANDVLKTAGQEQLKAPQAVTVAATESISKATAALGKECDREREIVVALAKFDRVKRDLSTAQSRASESADVLSKRLAEHQFVDTAEVEAAALLEKEIAEREQASIRHSTETEHTTAALAADEIVALDAEAVADDIDLEIPAIVLEEAKTRLTECHGQATARQADLDQLTAEAAKVTMRLDQLGQAQADAGPRLRMAELASGNQPTNPLGMSLSTYVLVTRFEDVVAAANARLRVLSDGQFELIRSTEREQARKRRVGLSLAVRDHYTGDQRNPGSLSGGQTFYVSLCLALGLTDVVQAEAGGVELGTLFVDEGFGTLDPSVLEAVMATLTGLHDTGRVVGIVSHVDSLKQSIAERIEVRKRPGEGSTLTVLA